MKEQYLLIPFLVLLIPILVIQLTGKAYWEAEPFHYSQRTAKLDITNGAIKVVTFDKKRYKMLTFKGHYFGNGSFLSRSLSSPKKGFFPVDCVSHPKEKNEEKVLDEIGTLANPPKALYEDSNDQFSIYYSLRIQR